MTQGTIDEHQTKCNERRARLSPGPWQWEPDRLNWKSHGLDCMVVRASVSFGLCGYVGVKKGHPLYGKGYDDAHEAVEINVHGGLTYSDACGGYVCHIDDAGADPTWWFGFDCSHHGDISPGYDLDMRKVTGKDGPSAAFGHGQYRDIEYVKRQVESLAQQLAAA